MSLRLVAALLLSIALSACAGAPQAADPPPADEAAGAASDLHAEVDTRCRVDADCEVKNIGNCCGYYPACVNRASPTFPEQVMARCREQQMSSICGFPELAGCTCIDGRCTDVPGPGTGLDLR